MKRILFFLMAFAVAAGMTGCGDDKSTDPTPGPGPTPDPDPEPTPEETYSIGDYYEKGFVKGIVCRVDETGQHGYILALEETTAVWSYLDENVMDGFPSENGMTNCKRIYARSGWQENYPGFRWAYDMNVMGLENWYVPSHFEYNYSYEAYTGRSVGGGSVQQAADAPTDVEEHKAWFNAFITAKGGTPLSDALYWTSAELGPSISYVYDLAIGDFHLDPQADIKKTLSYRFRAISKF